MDVDMDIGHGHGCEARSKKKETRKGTKLNKKKARTNFYQEKVNPGKLQKIQRKIMDTSQSWTWIRHLRHFIGGYTFTFFLVIEIFFHTFQNALLKKSVSECYTNIY